MLKHVSNFARTRNLRNDENKKLISLPDDKKRAHQVSAEKNKARTFSLPQYALRIKLKWFVIFSRRNKKSGENRVAANPSCRLGRQQTKSNQPKTKK